MDIIIGNTDIELCDIMSTRKYRKKLSEDVDKLSDSDYGERILTLKKIERFAHKATFESCDEMDIIYSRIIHNTIDIPGIYYGKSLIDIYEENSYHGIKCLKDVIAKKYNLPDTAITELSCKLRHIVNFEGVCTIPPKFELT